MKRVCVACRCIIDADQLEECPRCEGELNIFDSTLHIDYREMDVD